MRAGRPGHPDDLRQARRRQMLATGPGPIFTHGLAAPLGCVALSAGRPQPGCSVLE